MRVQNHNWTTLLVAVVLLWTLFAQTATSTRHLSATHDEPVHITTGYSIWTEGDLRLVEDHPPFLEMWMSWPLLLANGLPDPTDIPAWRVGSRNGFAHDGQWWSIEVDTWLIPARIASAWLGILLGALLFRWTHAWFGASAALLSLALLVFSPNVLAHASLANLDLGLALVMFATIYVGYRWLQVPSPTRAILLGGLLGVSLSTKVASIILFPVMGGLCVLQLWRQHQVKALSVQLVVTGVTTAITVWALHLFDVGTLPEIPVPVPVPTLWGSLINVFGHVTTANRRAFLLGKNYLGGVWYYFPVAFLVKTPLPTLLLFAGALLNLIIRRDMSLSRLIILAALPVAYTAVSITSDMNIGYRHMLPVLPFVFLFTGSLLAPSSRRPLRWLEGARVIAGLVLMGWLVIEAVSIWPNHLTYFNQAVGGPDNGYNVMIDSNLDWHQSLKQVRRYLDETEADNVYLSTYAFYMPLRAYDLQEVTPIPPSHGSPPMLPSMYNPAPGTYIIGASTYHGLLLGYPEMYDWFHHREPDDLIGNAMLVYHVPPASSPPSWVGQCGIPTPPLTPEMVVERFGRSDLRMVTVDCTQTWLLPGGGTESG